MYISNTNELYKLQTFTFFDHERINLILFLYLYVNSLQRKLSKQYKYMLQGHTFRHYCNNNNKTGQRHYHIMISIIKIGNSSHVTQVYRIY